MRPSLRGGQYELDAAFTHRFHERQNIAAWNAKAVANAGGF